MRAFLSHSSANKDFAGEVFFGLGAANAEYDERTFSAGRFNTEAIRESLSRCDVFVLFATRESLASGYVEYEIAIAGEFFASRKLRRILTFCIGGVTPSDLPASLKPISAIRRTVSAGVAVRSIKAELIDLEVASSPTQRPYLGRDQITRDIKARLAAPDEPTPAAIAFSGVDGIGRRTLASKVLADVYPGTGKVHPAISIGPNFDSRDMYRALLDLSGGLRKSDLLDKVREFDSSTDEERYQFIADSIVSHNRDNEILFFVDTGGLLEQDGRFSKDAKEVLRILSTRLSHSPYIIFILFRTPPAQARERNGVYYFRVDPLEVDDIKRLVSLHIKNKGQLASSDEVSRLVDLIDGHPYNLQFLLRLLDTYSMRSLLDDPSDLVAFKKRQGDDFISRISLNNDHIEVLSVLRALGQSSVDLISSVVNLEVGAIGRALKELEEFHCIERIGSVCSINRPLKAAFERSSILKLSLDQITRIQSKAIDLFNSYKNDDQIDIEIISAAARAAVFLNKDDSSLRAFLSPSNSIIVARQLYDLRRYADCARVCQTALRSQKLISQNAAAEAIRLRCLSLARLGDDDAFHSTLALLGVTQQEKALGLFLEGFRFRLDGNPDQALVKFRQSYAINSTSFSTLRELSHALMTLGEIEEAKSYSERALLIAPTNPYVIDQLLALRVGERQKVNRDIIYDPEISDLLDKLQRYGDEEGKSFYAIRMADILRRSGRDDEAMEFAKRAAHLTPSLVPAYLIEAEILIKQKKYTLASRKIESIGKIIDDRNTGEGRSTLPDYVYIKSMLLIESGEVNDAISLLISNERRIKRKIPDLKRKISFQVDREGVRISNDHLRWLRST